MSWFMERGAPERDGGFEGFSPATLPACPSALHHPRQPPPRLPPLPFLLAAGCSFKTSASSVSAGHPSPLSKNQRGNQAPDAIPSSSSSKPPPRPFSGFLSDGPCICVFICLGFLPPQSLECNPEGRGLTLFIVLSPAEPCDWRYNLSHKHPCPRREPSRIHPVSAATMLFLVPRLHT